MTVELFICLICDAPTIGLDYSPAGRYGQFKPKATMVHVWHFICQPTFIIQPGTTTSTFSITESFSACSDLVRILISPPKKYQVQLFSGIGHCLNGSFISPSASPWNPVLQGRFCSSGYLSITKTRDLQGLAPCVARLTAMKTWSDGKVPAQLDFLLDGWMDGTCVFPLIFVPYILYSYIRPQCMWGWKEVGLRWNESTKNKSLMFWLRRIRRELGSNKSSAAGEIQCKL